MAALRRPASLGLRERALKILGDQNDTAGLRLLREPSAISILDAIGREEAAWIELVMQTYEHAAKLAEARRVRVDGRTDAQDGGRFLTAPALRQRALRFAPGCSVSDDPTRIDRPKRGMTREGAPMRRG